MRSSASALALSLLLPLLFLGGRASASDEESIRAVYSAYWKAYSSSDWMGAAECMHPGDLDEMQKHLLPVFLEVAQKTDQQSKAWAAKFFGDTPLEKRAAMTPKEVFAASMRFGLSNKRELLESLKRSKLEITKVEVSGEDGQVHFTTTDGDEVSEGVVQVGKKDGKWWLRNNEPALGFSKRLRKAFGL